MYLHLLRSPGSRKFCWLELILKKGERESSVRLLLGIDKLFHLLHMKSLISCILYTFFQDEQPLSVVARTPHGGYRFCSLVTSATLSMVCCYDNISNASLRAKLNDKTVN